MSRVFALSHTILHFLYMDMYRPKSNEVRVPIRFAHNNFGWLPKKAASVGPLREAEGVACPRVSGAFSWD